MSKGPGKPRDKKTKLVKIPLDEVMPGLEIKLPTYVWDDLRAYGQELLAAKRDGRPLPSPHYRLTPDGRKIPETP